jgi:hypothetical protein
MGFRRIGSVWFFGLLSAAFFVVLAATLTGGRIDGTVETVPGATVVPASRPAVERPAPRQAHDPAPMLEARMGNVDRRAVMVPGIRVGALLNTDAGLVLP